MTIDYCHLKAKKLQLNNDRQYSHNQEQVNLTWPNNSYKHLDRIPYLQQSMDIDDFGIDSSHNDSHEIDFYSS